MSSPGANRLGGLAESPRPVYFTAMRRMPADQFSIGIARLMADMKSERVVVLDLREISSITDFTVIGTGTSERQIRAVAERIVEFGKSVGDRPIGVAGLEAARWVLVDFFDVVAHVFAPAQREYYDLELLWGDAPQVEWGRVVPPPIGTT